MYTSMPFRAVIMTVLSLIQTAVLAQNTSDTRLLSDPAVSKDNIAFIYAEDLWIVDRDGSNPRRLTIDEGVESNPVFSPDGAQIAFSAEYDGNTDVFIIPSAGGIPRRLTWHPSPDWVRDFSPDGTRILFASQRNSYTNRYAQLYTVATTGGRIESLPIPNANWAAYSPDGTYIAYTPLFDAFDQWKNYRGGRQTRIWVYSVIDHSVIEVPKPENGSNDSNPQWVGQSVFFRSDRNGEFNVYSFNMDTRSLSQHTSFDDFPVLKLSANGRDFVFEQSGYLHRMDPATGTRTRLKIGIAADLLELRPRYVSGASYIRSASVSPSGARVVFDFRGEIITVPAKKGDPANLTETPGVHEKYPVWSPDGRQIAYFSDASGEYALHVRQLEGGYVKSIPLSGTGFYAFLHWSPDSRKLAYVDNGRNLYVTDVATGNTAKVNADVHYIPGVFREMFGSWSHDSKWLAYTQVTGTNFQQAFVYSIDQNKSFGLTDGLSNVSNPVFDPSGKYIYLLASTDAGPVVNWFDQSNQDMEASNSIYVITLQKELLSPLARENEVEIANVPVAAEEKPKNVRIDWAGIQNRIIDLPIRPGLYSDLAAAAEGHVYYLSRSPHSGAGESPEIRKYDLKAREDKSVMQADEFQLSADGKKMLYRQKQAWGITETGKKPEDGTINSAAIQVKIDPVQEWKNIFYEAWRVNRDYFYDPGMHGLDWEATKSKYQVFLPDVTCRSDLYRMMQWMFSELAVGHHRFSSRGDRMRAPDKIGGGLLGADYEIANNRYRITKLYGGLNWTPDLRSPLTEAGINVEVGEYILAVNGKEITGDQNFYQFFENTAGKIVELTVGTSPSMANARKVKVVPVSNENALRHRDWVEGNRRKVSDATNGQVAYVYVPNTATAGHEYFKRYFFPQADKKAIIVDERHNGGGQLADYYIDMLKKPYQSHWNFRYGQDMKAPSASIQGPKAMLIDETAGSGGDYLPWMFRKFDLGLLIGKRTWGGLVGVLGYPEFIDGGSVTAPNVAFWNEDGFRIENEGVAPDVEVEQWPADVMAGKDPQLDKAIEWILKQLEENPPATPVRPDYPVRVRQGN